MMAYVHFQLIGALLLAALILALLLTGFAVYMKDHVETNLKFLSFGFSLKADNDKGKKI